MFEIRNKNKKLVDTITTDNNGVATTKELPYGSYYIHQTKGKVGYEMATDMYKTIVGSDENEVPIYRFEAYNRKQKACIAITKRSTSQIRKQILIRKRRRRSSIPDH